MPLYYTGLHSGVCILSSFLHSSPYSHIPPSLPPLPPLHWFSSEHNLFPANRFTRNCRTGVASTYFILSVPTIRLAGNVLISESYSGLLHNEAEDVQHRSSVCIQLVCRCPFLFTDCFRTFCSSGSEPLDHQTDRPQHVSAETRRWPLV